MRVTIFRAPPTGTAPDTTNFKFPACSPLPLQNYIGAGMICPQIVSWSMLFGSIISWGILWPVGYLGGILCTILPRHSPPMHAICSKRVLLQSISPLKLHWGGMGGGN